MRTLLMLLFAICLGTGSYVHGDVTASQSALVVVLLGPPGSGKGTQASRLSRQLALPHISTGDLFREHLKTESELGKKAKGYMAAGKLVPDELVFDMLWERVGQPDAKNGYILDGFPRTVPQAETLTKRLEGNAKVVVMNLEVPDDVITKRATGRLVCKECGNIQHKESSAPKVEGECDKCGGELIQRPDDRQEVVEERLRVYHTQTEPVVGYYKQKGMLHTIDGTQAPDAVFDNLVKTVEKEVK